MDGKTDVSELQVEMQPELEEALLGLDELATQNAQEALNMFHTLPSPVQERPDFQLVLARTHQALGSLEKARDLSLRVLESVSTNADAHHLLGDVLEDLGDTDRANEHFLETLKLDREHFELDSEIPPEELFARLDDVLKKTCNTLPKEFTLQSQVQLLPSTDEVRAGLDPRALTSYCPPPTSDPEGALFTLYAANLDAEFGDLQEFGEFAPHVGQAIQRELMTHLSLSPAEIGALGWELPEDNEDDEDGEDGA